MKKKTQIDFSNFKRSMQKAAQKYYPEMIANAFSQLSSEALGAARIRVREKYDLHTEWIPEHIAAVPVTESQRKASARMLKSHGDMIAAVYFQGSADPSKSMGFMADHEEGETRKPKKKLIAAPGPDYDEQRIKTASGKTKFRELPATLLKRFNEVGSSFTGGTTKTKTFPNRRPRRKGGGLRTAVGSWFIIQTKRMAILIARRNPLMDIRKGKRGTKWGLEFRYALSTKEEIDADMDFMTTVYGLVERRMRSAIKTAESKIPRKI